MYRFPKNKIRILTVTVVIASLVSVLIFYYENNNSFAISSPVTISVHPETQLVLVPFSTLMPYSSSGPIVEIQADITSSLQGVPKTVYGEGLLNYVASDNFVRSAAFQSVVTDAHVGALRWPSAGHSHMPIFHFDNNHTEYFEGKAYSTKNEGNIWDPLYTISDSAPANEIVTLDGFVNVLKNTSTTPLMVFSWRSGELWRVIDNKKVFYHDPAPRTIEGEALSVDESKKMSGRELQFLENRLMLKTYYAEGGPTSLVAQIGEEMWSGWIPGQIPWDESDLNPQQLKRSDWIAQAIKPYFADLATYAKINSYPIRFAAQFRESTEGGNKMPLPAKEVLSLQGDLAVLLKNLGPYLSFMTASMHYRGTWQQWLSEPQMQMAFITDQGQGSLADIHTWFKRFVAAAGYPAIDIIPHANSFGEVSERETAPEPWQIGLMSTQYLIEAIKAGYEFTFGFPGFLGDYLQIASLEKANGIAGVQGGVYSKAPMLYALASIGSALQENSKLVIVRGVDTSVVTLGLLSSASEQKHLRLYFINKHATTVTSLIDVGTNLSDSYIGVQRYSQTEMLTSIPPADVLKKSTNGMTKMYVNLEPFSLTVIDVSI